MYQNRLSLIGFSGKEPEQKFTKNGAAYTVLSLATKTSWKNDNDEWESRTEWHRIIAWSKLGEFSLLPRALIFRLKASSAAANTRRTV
jgi:single-strand DNA-binding protein